MRRLDDWEVRWHKYPGVVLPEIPRGNAVVVLSGGQDTATCVMWAKRYFRKVYAVTFKYGQTLDIELRAAKTIVRIAELAGHEIIDISEVSRLLSRTTSLVRSSDLDISWQGGRGVLPTTFVPGRNLLFLVLGAMYAYSVDSHHLVIGVNFADWVGYPDCRPDVFPPLEESLRQGMEWEVKIHAPLLYLDKARINWLAEDLQAYQILYPYTHTCYRGERPPCGTCPACITREWGFKLAGLPDPLTTMGDQLPELDTL